MEISMEIGMLNFWLGLLVTALICFLNIVPDDVTASNKMYILVGAILECHTLPTALVTRGWPKYKVQKTLKTIRKKFEKNPEKLEKNNDIWKRSCYWNWLGYHLLLCWCFSTWEGWNHCQWSGQPDDTVLRCLHRHWKTNWGCCEKSSGHEPCQHNFWLVQQKLMNYSTE